MSNPFFDRPILNSPYERPPRHWELDAQGQSTQRVIEQRRRAEFITPIPKPKKRRSSADQQQIIFDEGKGLSTKDQQYDPTSIINEVRQHLDQWRALPHPNQWQVTPETARLLEHWRHHKFSGVRPFFCQVEARVLNQAVKRHLERFLADFMFQLTPGEAEDVRPWLQLRTKSRGQGGDRLLFALPKTCRGWQGFPHARPTQTTRTGGTGPDR